MFNNPKYFEKDYACIEHGDYKCEECQEESEKPVSVTALVIPGQQVGWEEREQSTEAFEKQITFVKTALDYSEIGMDKVKVSDLPKLVKEAQQKITVGKMKTLLGVTPKPKKPSVTKGVLHWLRRKLAK